MTVQLDYSLPLHSDGTIQINLIPATSISGWTLQHDLMYRLNSPQPIISKFMSSGFTNNQSGMKLIDGINGVFQVQMFASEVSGFLDGNYAYRVHRTDSGNASDNTAGFRLAQPY